LEDEFVTPSELSEDNNVDTNNTNSTNSFSTAREYNEASVIPPQSQNTRRLSTGDLFDSIIEDDSLDDTPTNSNVGSSVFVTEVPQHIYDPAEYLYLEKKVCFFFDQQTTVREVVVSFWCFILKFIHSFMCLFIYLFIQFSLSEIAKHLKQEGHSDSIINAIIQKLNNLHRHS
jgi:hypothetical protein